MTPILTFRETFPEPLGLCVPVGPCAPPSEPQHIVITSGASVSLGRGALPVLSTLQPHCSLGPVPGTWHVRRAQYAISTISADGWIQISKRVLSSR